MFDLVIAGGTVYDGTGNPPQQADVAIRDGIIQDLGNFPDAPAVQRLDATDCAVMPGFIDVHTHVDMRVFSKPLREEALTQGVTTEIAGACGIGLFPAMNAGYAQAMSGIYGQIPAMFPSCDAYLSALPPTGVNVAVQLAHSPLRLAVSGNRDEPLLKPQAMELVRQAFDEGVCGLSTGLAYYPASFGDTREVADLAALCATCQVPVSVHQRTAWHNPEQAFDPREEVLDFARLSGAPVQFSHYRTTPQTAGQLEQLLDPIRRGLQEGLNVTADFYPYPVGAGYVPAMLPMWAMTGSFQQVLHRLELPEQRQLIKDFWTKYPARFLSDSVFLHAPKHLKYLNRTFADVADERKQSIPDMVLDLLLEERLQLAFRINTPFVNELPEQLERDFIQLMQQPFYMFGSDTLPAHAFPHPRSRGAFARLLKLAVKHQVPLQTFARAAAGLPAQTFKLKGRGVVARGMHADLAVFNPQQVRDRATFNNPWLLAEGMDLVIVNGKIAVRNGQATGVMAGQPLRRDQF